MSQTKVQLKNVRLSFPKLFKPESMEEGGKLNYSASFLIDPATPVGAENLKKVKEAMTAACEDKWGKGKVPKLKSDRKALKDGDESDYDGYKDMQVVVAKDDRPPVLVDRDRSPLNETTCMTERKLYAGCYVNAVINFWTYDNKFGKGCSANLRAVQFAENGEEFSGSEGVNVDDEFDDLEGDAPETDAFDL
jgi:hypothetical protein